MVVDADAVEPGCFAGDHRLLLPQAVGNDHPGRSVGVQQVVESHLACLVAVAQQGQPVLQVGDLHLDTQLVHCRYLACLQLGQGQVAE